MAKGLHKSSIAITIDPFNADGEAGSKEEYDRRRGNEDLQQQFISKMKELGVVERIKIYKGYSNEVIDRVPQIDLLFIDGDHSISGCYYDYINY